MPIPLLLACFLASAPAAEVDISGQVFESLRPEREPRPEPGPGPWVASRQVELIPANDAVRVRVVWQIHAVEPGWLDLPLVNAPVRVDRATLGGASVALKSLSDGRRHLVAFIERPGELVLEGEVEGDLRRGVSLDLLEAPVGTLRVETSDPVVQVLAGDAEVVELEGSFWTGAAALTVSTLAEEPLDKLDELVVASVGLGVTVGDGDLRVRGRIRWRITRGALEQVQFTARGAGPDLEVTGPLVAGFDRQGDTITVELRRPETAGVEVEVRWSSVLPAGDEASLTLPDLAPVGVFRTERSVQIARDGDREVVPQLAGWAPTSSADLPEVARDLVTGTPTSAWTATSEGSGSLQLVRFTPVSGPPTIVDVAAYDGAFSSDGRLLLRAHYTVRNDRGAFLRVTPPAGSRVVAARVGGQPTTLARDGEAWLVPLLKSVETVQGLLDFPVDLVFLSDGVPFDRHDVRAVPLPSVDAEVAVTRVELSLPVRWRDRLEAGENGRVDDFSEGQGITYGFASGDGKKVAEADALFQDAVSAWMDNDFDEAQMALEQLNQIGASNANIGRLQSNLDLVFKDTAPASGASGGAEVALQRRVKEQAMARSGDDKFVQEKLLEEADQAYNSGDYGKAEEVYQQALEIGETLERLEQEESYEVKAENEKLRSKLSKSSAEKERRDAVDFKQVAPTSPADENEDDGTYRVRTEVDFEDETIDGELTKPDGAYDLDPAPAPEMPAAEITGSRGGAMGMLEDSPAEPEIPRQVSSAEASRRPLAQTVDRARGSVFGGMKKGAPPSAPPPPPSAPPSDDARPEPIQAAPEAFAPLEVTASTLDVVIPTFGPIVRYQHLLLPAGATWAVELHTKRERGVR